jgi:MSHA pilin protein MshC
MRGFTLVELVMVIVVMTILAIAILPRAPTEESLTLRGRAEQLAADIRYVQTLSMTTGERHCLTLTNSSYTLARDATCSTTVAHPGGLGMPVQLCSNCLTTSLSGNQLRFDGKGRPYLDATNEFSGTETITVSGDGGPLTISISRQTGRVIVQ